MKSKTKKRTTTIEPTPADLVAGDALAPVLDLVRARCAPGLDDLELEILAEQQAQFPPLPDVVPARGWSALVDRQAS